METARNPTRPTSGHFHRWLVADPSEAEWERGKWAEQAALWDSGIKPELPTFHLKIEQFCQKLRTCFGFFCCLFLFRISKDKLGENQVVKNRSVGQVEPLANEQRRRAGVLEESAKPPSSSRRSSPAAALLKA